MLGLVFARGLAGRRTAGGGGWVNMITPTEGEGISVRRCLSRPATTDGEIVRKSANQAGFAGNRVFEVINHLEGTP